MIKTNKVIFVILVMATILSYDPNSSFSQVTDIDGNTYKTVTIGTQVWMAENLNVEHYRNGDVITQTQDSAEWAEQTSGAWCYYKNRIENVQTCGKLYNWFTVVDPRGLAPGGWHIPTDADWIKLAEYLGGENVAGGKLKAITGWEDPNRGATNETGFSAFPSGNRAYFGWFTDSVIELANFWSASDYNSDMAWFRQLNFYSSALYGGYYYKRNGMSVRCVKD